METLKQQRRKDKLEELLKDGGVALIKHLFEIEESIDDLEGKIKPLSESQMEMVSRIVESVVDHVRLKDKGEDGKDYILTDEDKEEIVEELLEELPLEEIAKKVNVPVVEKVIERTEVIKEQPIIKTETTEVQVLDEKKYEENLLKNGDLIRDALELLPDGSDGTQDERLNWTAIKGLKKMFEKLEKQITNSKSMGGGMGGKDSIQYYDLSAQCDGVTKTFNIPGHYRVLEVKSTQFPITYRPLVDWTVSGTVLTLTSEVGAPETGQTLYIIYIA